VIVLRVVRVAHPNFILDPYNARRRGGGAMRAIVFTALEYRVCALSVER
jgi:hypothetical protein